MNDPSAEMVSHPDIRDHLNKIYSRPNSRPDGMPQPIAPSEPVRTQEIIEPGSWVKLRTGLEAIVEYVSICKDHVCYGLIWQNGNDIKQHAVDVEMIEEIIGEHVKRNIGFRS